MIHAHRNVRTLVLPENYVEAYGRALKAALRAMERDAARQDVPAAERDATKAAIPFLSLLRGSFTD